jgi:glycosyltransferase involved in cell wall biosynthesis
MLKKIILFEGEMVGGHGHHYHHMVESSLYLKNKGKIIWIVNKKFQRKNLFIPNFVKVFPVIDTGYRDLINNKNTIFVVIKNFFFYFYFLFFFNNFNYLNILSKNFFLLPKYFSSFFYIYKRLKITSNDVIIFQSARLNDCELSYFLSLIDKNYPDMHLRIIALHKKQKLKKFYFYLKKFLINKILFKKIFLYTETTKQSLIIKNDTGISLKVFNNILNFYSRQNNKRYLTIGFLGESRKDKGFDKVPDLIEKIIKINNNFKFIIQISKISREFKFVQDRIIKLGNDNKNIKIITGYLNFHSYRNILKRVDIMPILHTSHQLKNFGSGIIFSSLTNEIPIVILKNNNYIKKLFKFKSYLEAKNIDDYAMCVCKISRNYNYYLAEAKKQSNLYKSKLINDPLINKI